MLNKHGVLRVDDCEGLSRVITKRFEYMATSAGNTRALLRNVLKVVSDPGLAVALINAQVQMGGKARVPFSVRLIGRACLKGTGNVEFGQSVSLLGDIVPIELFSHRGARI